jgi:hypothetical protein
MTLEEKASVDGLEFCEVWERWHRHQSITERENCLCCWVYGEDFPQFVHRLCHDENTGGTCGTEEGLHFINPSEAELEQIFWYMRRFNVPAVDPADFELHIRLMKAGVRIVD